MDKTHGLKPSGADGVVVVGLDYTVFVDLLHGRQNAVAVGRRQPFAGRRIQTASELADHRFLDREITHINRLENCVD